MLLREADFVSINCPLTRESRYMIGAREFGLMRPDAYFVTTARGFIHDENALAEALAGEADRRGRAWMCGRKSRRRTIIG